jgi:hypothetical protein
MAKGKYEYWLTDEGLLQIGGWAKSGLTDEQIAHNMGICRDTLIQWKKKFPDISYSLKVNKEIADIQVENALFNKAVGMSVTVKKPIKLKKIEYNEFGRKVSEKEYVEMADEEVFVPPDTTAQIFWLKNRKTDVWSDRKDFNLKGEVDTTSSLSDDELNKKIANLEKKLGISDE